MGDNSEGSSGAARGAQADEASIGLLDWMFGRKKPVASLQGDVGSAADISAASEGAHDMLINVRNMRDVRIEDVAVPRADITAIPDTSTLKEIVAAFRDFSFSRLPVYTETLDNPCGFIHLKDLALGYGFDAQKRAFDLGKLLRPLLFAPPSMPMGVLLQKMQSERIHMALVIDEYGGVDGLVTIEDLVEQIVGEIADEHDPDEGQLWLEEAAGVYLCDSRAELKDFERDAGVDLLSDAHDEEVDTLGGLVLMLAGRVPVRGEVVLHPQGHEFEVVEADPRLLKRVRVRLAKAVPLENAAE